MKPSFAFVTILLLIFLAGCGGGGGNSTPLQSIPQVTRLNVRIIGDDTNAAFTNFHAYRDTLANTKLYNLDVEKTIPPPVAPYPDILLLHPSGQFGPADIATVKSYLGKSGVVLLGGAPSKLCRDGYGNPGVSQVVDLAPIADWFAGVRGSVGQATGVGTYLVNPNTRSNKKFDVAFSTTPIYAPKEVNYALTQGQLSVNTDVVVSSGSPANPVFAFAYEPASGQKVYFQDTLGEYPADQKTQQAQQPSTLDVFYRALIWAKP